MKRAALHSLGCKVNSYEADAMQELLEHAGYEIVPFSEEADVYIINTCSVTNIADRKSRQMIHKAKKRNPNAIVVAAGCYVQVAKEQAEQDSSIDIIIGNNKKKNLIKLLEEYEGLHRPDSQPSTDYVEIDQDKSYESLSITKTGEHTRAYIKVQDGCNQFCTYCIIPYARGRVRSRKKEDILKEARVLATNGYQEIVVTGIHVSSFGVDFQEGEENLLTLLNALEEVEGLERIRLSSLEPTIMTEKFIEGLASLKKLCPHFHLSLQSGSDAVLKRMNRHYNTEQFLECVRLLRKYFSHPAITTDIIAGFPGETAEEFEQTKAYLKKIKFYETHIFKYSKRQGTKAAQMKDQVDEEIKTLRSGQLIEISHENALAYRKQAVGSQAELLVEETVTIEGESYQVGHTREYIRAAVRSKEDLTNRIIIGTVESFLTNEILLLKM